MKKASHISSHISWRLLLWFLCTGLIFILFRKTDWKTLTETLRQSRWTLVILAGLLNITALTWSRTKRFSTLIDSIPTAGARVGFKDLIFITSATRALSMVLPARAGETLRVMRLHRRFGYALESIIAAISVETFLEVIALALPVYLLISRGFVSLAFETILYPVVALGVICLSLAVVYLMRRKRQGPFHLFKCPKTWLIALTWTWLGDLVDILMIWLCLKAVGISVGILGWFLILAGINLAISVPVPGHFGTLEAGALLVLEPLGVNSGQALAFALLYHSAHLIPVLLLGGISLQVLYLYD